MYIFFIFFVFIILLGIRNGFNIEIKNGGGYLSKENTQMVKGIFIIIVFFSHFNYYVEYQTLGDKAYLYGINYIGQNMVTLFLFYSGYGVMESIKLKKESYINKIPAHRVLNTLVKFDIAVLLFYILDLSLGEMIPPKKLLLSLIAWDTLGNSSWYIFAILIMYMCTYIAAKLSKGDKDDAMIRLVIITTILTVIYVAILMNIRFKEAHYYNTVLCYPLGMIWSFKKHAIERWLKENLHYYITLTLLVTAVFTMSFITTSGTDPIKIFLAPLFAIMIVQITMRIPIKSSLLYWCGDYLFEIYILQRLAMILFKYVGIADVNIYLYFVMCVVTTAIMAYAYRVSTKWINF